MLSCRHFAGKGRRYPSEARRCSATEGTAHIVQATAQHPRSEDSSHAFLTAQLHPLRTSRPLHELLTHLPPLSLRRDPTANRRGPQARHRRTASPLNGHRLPHGHGIPGRGASPAACGNDGRVSLVPDDRAAEVVVGLFEVPKWSVPGVEREAGCERGEDCFVGCRSGG